LNHILSRSAAFEKEAYLLHYENISDLPKSVRNLPRQAKAIYMKAFNSAWEECAGEDEASCEKAAHEAAWNAVKLEYEKDEETGEWEKIGDEPTSKFPHHMHRQHRK
jgi:cation transport regulator